MQTWSITLHGPAGIISTVDTGESQFVIGTETASDVFTVHGEGIALRHAWVWISEAGLQVEDLGGGTLVNGYQISERVQVEVPASVQVGDVTLIIEVKAVQPVAVLPTPSSLDVTIPQRAVTKSKASLEVTIPQRTPTRSNVQKIASTGVSSADSKAANKASPTCEYTLVREIARGGMGQIYFGEDPQLERQVAVKVSSISEDGEDPRFSKEAKVLAQLAHPNIVPIYNIGVDAQSRPFYSMKLIKGRTLQAVLNLIRDGDAAALKEYPRATLLTIFRKVCDAMMFAHSKGILHRDLKPENIMVGEYGEVLVMDWGLAKVLGEREEQGSVSRVNDTGDYGMTMEGEVMGTPQYMSPEQAIGMVAELDARSDIYSLGGILYAILTLRPPIDGTTLDEVLTKVKNGSISSMVTKRGGKGAVTVGAPTAMGAEAPEALQAVTLKAMATDRNKRYESVELFAADIESYQNGFATSAEQAGAFRQLVLFIKRNKGVSAAAALVLIIAMVFTLRLAASERVSRQESARAFIALAEAAEETSDSEQIRSNLSKVPAEFRDQTWAYLNQKSDSADLKIPAPDGKQWLQVDECPDDPNSVIAVQQNGQVYVLNTETGQLTYLWKSEIKPFSLFYFVVSFDGSQIALFWRRALSGSDVRQVAVEIRGLRDGKVIGKPTFVSFPHFRADEPHATVARLSSRFLLIRTTEPIQNSHERLQVWDVPSGKLLWERMRVRTFHLSGDQKTVFTLTDAGIFEQLDASSGTLISTAAKPFPVPHASFGESCMFVRSPSLKEALSIIYGKPFIRSYDIKKEALQWEAQKEGSPGIGVQMDLSGKFLATLNQRSLQGAVLEIRSASTGALEAAHPFVGRVNSVGIDLKRIAPSKNAFSVAFPNRILVWNISKSVPVEQLNGSVIPVASHLFQQRAVNKHSELTLHREISTSLADPPISKIVLDGEGFSGFPSFSTDRTRTKILLSSYGMTTALRITAGGLETLWGPLKLSGQMFSMNPFHDCFWLSKTIYEFSTGNKIATLAGDAIEIVHLGINLSQSGGWVGADHIVAAVMVDPAGSINLEKERMLYLWDARSGALKAQCAAPHVSALASSMDGKHIAEGGSDKRLRIRDGSTLRLENEIRVHDKPVNQVTWHPSKPIIVTSEAGSIRLWSTRTWEMLEELKIGPRYRLAVFFSADGKRLFVTSNTGTDVYEPRSLQHE